MAMGIPGVEYFAHAFELPPRIAKEFRLLRERLSADRAAQFGMVNTVVPRTQLRDVVERIAQRLADQPPLGNWLTKQAIHQVEELRGKRAASDAVFHMHHFAHAQNAIVAGDPIAGLDSKAMVELNRHREKQNRN